MYCVDFTSTDINIHSSYVYSNDYSAFDIIAVPCGTQLEGDVNPMRDDCEWNKRAVMNYLKSFRLNVIFNVGVFLPNEFGEDRIQKRSVLTKVYVDPKTSNWVGAYIQRATLNDEISLL